MPDKYLLAIDVGSSSVRSLLTDLTGKLVSCCNQEWYYNSPCDIAPLGKEFDPETLWQIICHNTAKAIKDAGINREDIISVSATSQREGMVLLDREGEELYSAPNIDLRALMEGLSIDSDLGEEIYSISGHTPSFLFAPAKLKWLEANNPDVYDKISTILTISDWIIYKLCGERVCEISGAAELGLIDIEKVTWSDRLTEMLHLPHNIYAQLVPAGTKVGRVTVQSAFETGLSKGTVVSAGAPDTQAGLIGMGIKDAGQTGIVMGWSAPVQSITGKPIFDSQARIWTSCHALTEKWILESSAGEAGNAYRWLKDIIFDDDNYSKPEEEIYNLMDHMAKQSPPGSDGVMAFIGPDVMNMSHLSLKYGGFLFPVPLSANNIGRAQLIRASMENLCYAIKANCIQIEMISGSKIKNVTIGGGLARSRLLAEILTSVLDFPVIVPDISEVSGLGATMCAATGAEIYSNLEEAIKVMKAAPHIFEPNSITALEYSECYERWCSVAEDLAKLSEGM